jgi:alpha-glucosidase
MMEAQISSLKFQIPMRPIAIAILFSALASAAPLSHTTTSPDGRHQLKISFSDDGILTYSLSASDHQLIAPSPLGLGFGEDVRIPAAGWQAKVIAHRKHNDTWKPLWGKRASVPDHYHETTIELTGPGAPFDKLLLTARAYNDGAAFRYQIPNHASGQTTTAAADLTTFKFAGDFTAWFYNGENHNLGPDKLSEISGTRLPVMTLQAADDCFLAVHEADLRSGEPLRFEKSGPTGFRALASPGRIGPGYLGPWRVIFCATNPGAMVDSHLLELLNPEPEGDFSWVKPGLATWDWRIDGAEIDGFKYTMSLPSWIRMVDFAAKHGMPHLVLDANWYGPEFETESNPVNGDKANDVRKLIAYGREKGVGIWLYLNDIGGRQYPLEQTLAQYAEWGAVGVKYGFMRGTPAEKNARTRLITELCAKHKLLCNFHDHPVHPYGQMRTWPNAVTREYNFTQLDAKKVFYPKTFVTSVFVNMLAGPLDMNNGMFDLRQGPTTRVDNNQEVPSTLVAEAARTLITFSGVTILPDIPEFYQKYPDLLAFIAAQKMPWKESKTLSGVIGDHIVMARQSAEGKWLVGAAASEAGRDLEIPLHFLAPGAWQATIVQDGESAHYLTNRETLRTEKLTVTATDRIHVKLAPGGGATVLLEK